MKEIDAQIAAAKVDTSRDGWRTSLGKPRAVAFAPEKAYFVSVKTNKGPLRIRLFTAEAPMHATSFLYLARLGFFDGLAFHRVIRGFMAQGGCPLGTGTGGPGYRFDGEYSPKLRHDRAGLLSQANAGPGTDGSQFFLTFVPTAWLDDKHTIFGEVVAGHETLKALEAAGSERGTPKEPLRIETAVCDVTGPDSA